MKREIVERKQTGDALQQSNQKFEAITSILPDGIGILSLDGKIQQISDKLVKMHGFSITEKNEHLGRSVFDFIDPSSHKALFDNVRKVLAGERHHKLTEYLAIKKDNSGFYIDVKSTLLFDSNGNPEGILYVERNISERKLEEEQRDRLIADLQKALSEVKTLRGFLPICSHCKNIRDDKGYWNQIESYIHKHSDAEFSHGICPECAKKYYPGFDIYED